MSSKHWEAVTLGIALGLLLLVFLALVSCKAPAVDIQKPVSASCFVVCGDLEVDGYVEKLEQELSECREAAAP